MLKRGEAAHARGPMAVAVAWWPSGRVEAWAAVAEPPTLAARGQADGVGDLYERMRGRGELARHVSLADFLRSVRGRLAGERVITGRGRHAPTARSPVRGGRQRMALALDPASGRPGLALGIRAVAVAVAAGRLRATPSLLLRTGLAAASVRRDEMGQPSLAAARQGQRIHAVRALVLAAFADSARPAGGGALAF